MSLSSRSWMMVVPVVLLAFFCDSVSLSAQSSNGDQTNCVNSLFTTCSNNPAQQQPTDNGLYNQNQTQQTQYNDPNNNQRGTDQDTQLYVDSAGTVTRRPTTDTSRRGELFPPDPQVDLQRLARSSTGEQLPIFGRDLFQRAPSTFAPADQIPSMADYVIGPGDDILLHVTGSTSLNLQLKVDSAGSIYVPKVGSIHVAGLRFEELQQHISTEMSHTFRNFNLSVNLGSLRSIQVYVVGEARRPGAYTVSSLSTILNVLFVSGGPNVQGSLRNIQVRRAGQAVANFDLYDLVLRGDKSNDIRLQAGDTIFIPAAGSQVALAGSVRHPAIYELKAETTLQNLLDLAGGFSPTASRSQVSLERIEQTRIRKAMNVELNTAGLGMALRDGDVLYVNHIGSGYEQSVTIRGNLANPGRFPWHPGMQLSEIIPDRMSLLTNGYWRERNRLGVPAPLFEPLNQNDRNQQGREPGLTGLNSNGDGNAGSNNYGQTGRNDQQYPPNTPPVGFDQNGQSNLNSQNAQALQTNRRNDNVNREDLLAPADIALTRGSLAEQQQATGPQNLAERSAQISIKIPVPEIDWSYAVIERLDPDTLKSSLVPFNLGRLVQDHDPNQNVELHPGDVVTILSQADIHVGQDEQTKYVRLEGEFKGAGVYSVGPNETLEDLVVKAGGLTSKAYLYGASFTRESARVFQQQRLDEYISTLSIDMQRAAAVRTASSTSGVADPTALAEQRNVISQLRQLRATGRVVLEFGPDSTGLDTIPKLPLENGDVFRVPSKPLTVSVIGAVYGQNVLLYNSQRKVEDYVLLAGKPNRVADRRHAFIIRADGSIYSHARAQGIWGNTFNTTKVYPGDAIVIPEKLIAPSTLRQLIDYSQIISSFALGAAAINIIR